MLLSVYSCIPLSVEWEVEEEKATLLTLDTNSVYFGAPVSTDSLNAVSFTDSAITKTRMVAHDRQACKFTDISEKKIKAEPAWKQNTVILGLSLIHTASCVSWRRLPCPSESVLEVHIVPLKIHHNSAGS